MATIGGALLLPPCVGPASITAVALSAVAMRANAEHGFASVAASRSKQDFWHPDDDKPPLRSGDDADGSLLNRRVIKKLHFLMRGDMLEQVLGIPLSLGTTQNAWEEARAAVAEPCQELEEALPQQPVLNGDETSSPTKKNKRWLWAFVAQSFV